MTVINKTKIAFVIYLYMMIRAGRYLVKVLFMLGITGSDKTCSVKTACLNHTVKYLITRQKI